MELRKETSDKISKLELDLKQIKIQNEWRNYLILAIGGTYLKVVEVNLINNTSERILRVKLNKTDLIEQIELHLQMFDLNNYDCLVINFAYPIRPFIGEDNLPDAYLKFATKGFDMKFGPRESILSYFKGKVKFKLPPVILVSDIVFALLSQKLQIYDSVFNIIQGTGSNMGILKQGITTNLEIGDLDLFKIPPSLDYTKSIFDLEKFRALEFLSGGRYIYSHYNYYANELNLKKFENTENMLDILTIKDDLSERELIQNILSEINLVLWTTTETVLDHYKFPKSFILNLEGGLIERQVGYTSEIKSFLNKFKPVINYNFNFDKDSLNVVKNLIQFSLK